MPRRTKDQWLEMIRRTRPTVFAANALEAEFGRNAASDGLTEPEINQVRAALEQLVLESQLKPTREAAPTERLLAAIEYRPNGSGSRGRLFIEIEGRAQLEPLENPALDDLKLYVMTDGSNFAGLQLDDATELPTHLRAALGALNALELPAVDCIEANLEGATIGDVLAWALEHRVLAGR